MPLGAATPVTTSSAIATRRISGIVPEPFSFEATRRGPRVTLPGDAARPPASRPSNRPRPASATTRASSTPDHAGGGISPMLGTNLSTTRQLPVRVPSHVHEQLEHLRQQHPLRTRRHLLHFQRRDRGHLLGREHRWAVDGDRHGVLRHGGRLGLVGRALREGSRRYPGFCSRARAGWRADQAHRARRCGRRGRGLVAVAWLSSSAAWSRPISSTTAVSGTGIPTSHMACSSHESKCHLAGSAAQVEHLDPRPEVAIPAPSPSRESASPN